MPNDIGERYTRLGVLDIGSNSVRFVIYELFGAAFSAIYNEKVLAGLGRDLGNTGCLSPDGCAEALAAIKRFKIIAEAQNLDRVLVGATAALREAKDAPKFIQRIADETGLDISPVSGPEEARLTALGLIAAQPRAKGVAADLGGASLELIEIDRGNVLSGVSFPIGPFQVIGRDLRSDDPFDVNFLRSKIMTALTSSELNIKKGEPLYLIGGAWRNLAGVHQSRHLYPMRTLQAYTLMPGAAQDLARWAYGPGRLDILNWPGLNKRRAETLPYSGLLLDILMTLLDPPKVVISTTGLREGLVYDSMPDALRQRDSLIDGCRDLARGNLQGQHFASPLFDFLTPLDSVIPRTFTSDNETRLRRAACELVGIGKGLHPDYRADLVFEDILYAPLAGLSHKERAYLALILFHSYTSAQNTPNFEAIKLLLSHNDRVAARIYGTAIRLGVVASGRSPKLLSEFHLSCKGKTLTLSVDEKNEDLLTERVTHRLNKLGQLLGKTAKITEILIEKQ